MEIKKNPRPKPGNIVEAFLTYLPAIQSIIKYSGMKYRSLTDKVRGLCLL